MDTLTQTNEPKRGINKVFIVALLIGALIIAGIVGLIALLPSSDGDQQQALEGAYREGSPEFEKLTKKIIIQTDTDRTTQSPTGLGTIMMTIVGKIRNTSDVPITGLEVKVGVVDQKNNVLKERTLNIVPKQYQQINPSETAEVTTTIGGFKRDEDRANVFWKVTAIKTQ